MLFLYKLVNHISPFLFLLSLLLTTYLLLLLTSRVKMEVAQGLLHRSCIFNTASAPSHLNTFLVVCLLICLFTGETLLLLFSFLQYLGLDSRLQIQTTHSIHGLSRVSGVPYAILVFVEAIFKCDCIAGGSITVGNGGLLGMPREIGLEMRSLQGVY